MVSTATDVLGTTLSEPVTDETGSETHVFTLKLGSAILSLGNCRTSSVEVGIPEIFGVTGISEVVRTLVLTLPRDLDSVKRVRFARSGFDSGDKDG